MKKQITISILGFALIFFVFSGIKQSYAISKIGSGYTIANFRSLINTVVASYTGLDRPGNLIDGYARLFHCDVVTEKFNNEFEWQKIRDNLNAEIDRIDREYYRYYEFSGPIELDRYNFEKGEFPLSEVSKLDHIGFLSIYMLPSAGSLRTYCGEPFVASDTEAIEDFLPIKFILQLDRPVSLSGIKVDQDVAKDFVRNIAKRSGGSRIVYIRFRVKITDLLKVKEKEYRDREAVFSGSVKELDIFMDEGLTQHFSSIKIR